MKLVITLFSEITIKSAQVRRKQIRQLRYNIRAVCGPLDENFSLSGHWDRLELETRLAGAPLQDMIQRLTGISGIHQVLQVQEYPLETLEALAQQVQAVLGESLQGQTFCVRVKRTGAHPFTSHDVERFLGAALREQVPDCSVNLTAPAVRVELEIRHDRWYLVERRHKGPGGYPMGTQAPVLSLLSGGFDSAVASYQTMRRGLNTHLCFFDLGGPEHEQAVREMAWFLWSRYGALHDVHFVAVPFAGVVNEIVQRSENRYRGVILKRMMMRAASRIADRMGITTLVTGEAVAQVASQTLANLAVIDASTDKLVLRPLITTDKQDIIALAEQVGTAAMSRAIPEYCGAIAHKASAHVRAQDIEAAEARLDFSCLEQAIEASRCTPVSQWPQEKAEAAQAPVNVVCHPDPEHVIIDIRHPGERDAQSLEPAGCAVVTIPFYELARRFVEMDKARQYLLYCDRGVMSHVQALHLRDAGHTNVCVFQPAS